MSCWLMSQKAFMNARATSCRRKTIMMKSNVVEVPIKGMDCVACAATVQKALLGLQGVQSVNVFLNSEKAVIEFDKTPLEVNVIRRVVEKAGYSVPDVEAQAETHASSNDFSK